MREEFESASRPLSIMNTSLKSPAESQRYPRKRSITPSTVMMPHYWLNCLFITAVRHFGACLKKYNDRNLPYGSEAGSKLHAAMFHLSVRKPSPLSSLLNLAPILSHSSPSTFWGDARVRFGSCDASGIQRSDNSSSIISDSTSISLLQKSVRFRFFFFFLSFVLTQFQSALSPTVLA